MLLADTVSSESYEHPVWGSGLSAINIDTVRNTAIAFGLLLVVAVIVRTQLQRERPTALQNLLEWFVDAIRGLINQTMGERDIRLAPIAITLFAFLIVCNLIGLIPTLKSPTNDVNTAMALSLFAISMVHFQSLRFRGPVGYISHYFSVVTPSWKNPLGAFARIIFAIIEILIEVTKPFTLAFRLYFNIFVGELLLAILIFLLGFLSPIVGGAWVFFSIFVGIIQAFIFTMLTISYVAQSTETHHDDASHGADAAAA
ncbi:MAG: F0F1 ATP synthase subunit A [Candidatus Dormibacteria bacterium]